VRTAVAAAAVDAPADALLFVNVHGLELNDEELFAAGAGLGPHASRVVLEITERTGIDPAAGPTRVAMLRKLGYRIAVDDLGAGYAALGALASLEPEVVKLDMSLVRDIDNSTQKQSIVRSMLQVCRDELGVSVICEGVETAAERDTLDDLGSDTLQGYFFGRPSASFSVPSWSVPPSALVGNA
jgi:EAL domain-containing protein (putative c-di-GMP-specific phosphodiesterase class I)